MKIFNYYCSLFDYKKLFVYGGEEYESYSNINTKRRCRKTTTSINLAAALAEKNKKVLLVDFDPQGNATIGCGFKDVEETIVNAMIADINNSFKPSDLSVIHTELFDILPSNIELSNMELTLVSVIGREGVLKRILAPIKNNYDYIIIDTLPSLGILTVNAFVASDYVIVPVQAKDYYSLQGFDALLQSVELTRRCINPNLEVLGDVITMYDGRTKMIMLFLKQSK